MTNKGNQAREKAVLIVQSQFARLGVRASVDVVEWSSFLARYIDSRNFDTAILGWQLTLDPDQYPIWHSSQTGPGGLNFIGFKDPVSDRLMEEGRTTFDHARRIALARALHRRLAELQPVAFLYAPDALSALSLKFHGLLETPTGYDWRAPTRWYIPASLQESP